MVCPKIFEPVSEQQVDGLIVIAGGVMPDADVVVIEEMGVREIPLQDTPPEVIVSTLCRAEDGRDWRPRDWGPAPHLARVASPVGSVSGCDRNWSRQVKFGSGSAMGSKAARMATGSTASSVAGCQAGRLSLSTSTARTPS